MLWLTGTAFHASSLWPWGSVLPWPDTDWRWISVVVVAVAAMARFRHLSVRVGNLAITGDAGDSA